MMMIGAVERVGIQDASGKEGKSRNRRHPLEI
jgi:hypothetical protein